MIIEIVFYIGAMGLGYLLCYIVESTKNDDWRIVHKEKSSYNRYRGPIENNNIIEGGLSHMVYLKYSPSRDKYKITYDKSIVRVEASDAYQKCLEVQMKLENPESN